MAYLIRRLLKGHWYLYRQTSKRIPGKKHPKTFSEYLGPIQEDWDDATALAHVSEKYRESIWKPSPPSEPPSSPSAPSQPSVTTPETSFLSLAQSPPDCTEPTSGVEEAGKEEPNGKDPQT